MNNLKSTYLARNLAMSLVVFSSIVSGQLSHASMQEEEDRSAASVSSAFVVSAVPDVELRIKEIERREVMIEFLRRTVESLARNNTETHQALDDAQARLAVMISENSRKDNQIRDLRTERQWLQNKLLGGFTFDEPAAGNLDEEDATMQG